MTIINKAVILAAGLGTRLIPYSKEMPKEMLPIYTNINSFPTLKPILQIIFEQLYEAGVREYCFVVGRGKRHIEDHFTPDWDFVEEIEKKGKEQHAKILSKFYEMIEDSLIVWVNQPRPRGTGDAIYQAKRFVEDDVFFAVAGDNIYLGKNVFLDLVKYYLKYRNGFLTVKNVKYGKNYGIIEYSKNVEEDIVKVKRIVEKPKHPPSNLANTSLYIMFPEIFSLIEKCKPSPRGEIEITDAVQMFIDDQNDVYAYIVRDAYWIDVGNPLSYLKATLYSLKLSDKEAKMLDKVYEILKSKPSDPH